MKNEEVNTLRYGSFINYNGGFNIVLAILSPTPTDDRFDGLYTVEINPPDSFYVPLSEIEPIIITPEVLVKLGFTKDGFGSYNIDISPFENSLKQLSFSGDYLYLREGSLSDSRHEDNIYVLWNKDLMKEFYVHELQQLFTGLTRKELKYESI